MQIMHILVVLLNIAIEHQFYLLKMVIFHSYVGAFSRFQWIGLRENVNRKPMGFLPLFI